MKPAANQPSPYRVKIAEARSSLLWREPAQRSAADPGPEFLGNVRFVAGAFGVSEAGRAFPVGAEVVDDGVLLRCLAKVERIADTPGDIVVGAGAVAADAEAPYNAAGVVERQTTAKHDDAADAFAERRIGRGSELRCLAGASFRRRRAGLH